MRPTVWKQIDKNIFKKNRLATLATEILGNSDPNSTFLLCRIMCMPSLVQTGLTEWNNFEQLKFFLKNWVGSTEPIHQLRQFRQL